MWWFRKLDDNTILTAESGRIIARDHEGKIIEWIELDTGKVVLN